MRALAVGLLALLLGLSIPSAADPATCTTHTAWTGTEASTQHDGATLLQIPVNRPMTITGLDLSDAYAQRNGPQGFSEALFLVGIADQPLTTVDQLPALPPDPAFGDNTVTSDSRHNENSHVSPAVASAVILKSYTGAATAQTHVELDRQVQPGGVVWIYYASVSGPVLDPEVQAVITYCN